MRETYNILYEANENKNVEWFLLDLLVGPAYGVSKNILHLQFFQRPMDSSNVTS